MSAIMRPCTGCFEPGELRSFETLYPWSDEHQCRIGAGCGECNGTGLTELAIPSDDELRAMMAEMDRACAADRKVWAI